MRSTIIKWLFYIGIVSATGCSKFLDVDPPIDTLTTAEVFATNQQAEWAIAGVYSKMINGMEASFDGSAIAFTNFGAGLSTIMGGLSADDMMLPIATGSNPFLAVVQNRLALDQLSYSFEYWRSAYKVIYDANAVMEGIAQSTAAALTDSARKQVTGEALALRAFCYFYLVNFYGDVPLVLSTDFNGSVKLGRTAVAKVYEQMLTDLTKASNLLNTDFTIAGRERIRINKWFAEALLARVYLYTGNYQRAVEQATNVIGQRSLFSLAPLPDVFLKNSGEAILQLQPTNQAYFNNATPEGFAIGHDTRVPEPNFALSKDLAAAFEPGDKRKQDWTMAMGEWLAPYKYKVRMENSASYGPQSEYYMVMRLAELYLIRAEANILLSDANTVTAVNDLNVLRQRANLDLLETTLTAEAVKTAIAQERRVELFAEWGHRWLDLKRTGRATQVLPALSYKQPWLGDYQLLYPIPPSEIETNANLQQNPLYNR
ncbi:MAG: RagB/SusD family nutrient uptake outer membrane protein [Candidatus Pseudobacter hemicellulosilyticus]|uniref:RagB/SusD family nutrient uptake outer membrane protein n=1 Tax=Candidatus Pseudobacter hemicellulosilyticus TaxID=3121375 RepID=A0AAJ5WQU5_9BACT|nr:MAG: RagB/SusD family nutrient uptake outer membrane protein [Pseudobacter sp.]